jgi:hypothetical protein
VRQYCRNIKNSTSSFRNADTAPESGWLPVSGAGCPGRGHRTLIDPVIATVTEHRVAEAHGALAGAQASGRPCQWNCDPSS